MRTHFQTQADACRRLGSEFTANLLAGLGQELTSDTETGKMILDWPGPPEGFFNDAVALRLAGGLNALVRSGKTPNLAAFYPPTKKPNTAPLIQQALKTINQADKVLVDWMRSAPQTNEVARSSVLYPGLMTIAKLTGLSLTLWELGASAGLNLIPDHYSYNLGGAQFGKKGASVHLAPDWQGPEPSGRAPEIAGRFGCDLNPLDVQNLSDMTRLQAYIWPDQPTRLDRIDAAIKLAQKTPPCLTQADAAPWVEQHLAKPPIAGQTRVLMHSIAFQYFPKATQIRITDAMETAGESTTDETPLAWLSFEFQKEAVLTLRLWPGGVTHQLATADPHVKSVRWQNVDIA